MSELTMLGGETAKVDPDVYKWAQHFPWYLASDGYPTVRCGVRRIKLHRVVMDAPRGKHVHHLNYDKRDARRENLMSLSPSEHGSETHRHYSDVRFARAIAKLKAAGLWPPPLEPIPEKPRKRRSKHNPRSVYR